MIASPIADGLFTVDFHTHIDRESPLSFPENVLRIVSTPLNETAFTPEYNVIRTLELHPWNGLAFSAEFARAAADSKFAGIGEVGLDRIRGKLPLAQQIAIFRQTVELACALNKPLTVHCVKCFSELLELYKNIRWQVPTIIHYFRNKLPLAQQLLEHTNFYLSLPPGVPDEVLDFLRNNPEYLSRIVLETDDPHGDIITHYQNIAGKLDMSFNSLQQFMYQQYLRIYHEH